MTRDNIIVRPASNKDYYYFYNQDMPANITCWVGVLDNIKVGIGGYITENSVNTIFFHIEDAKKYNKATLFRAIVKGINLLNNTGLMFNAIRDVNLESSQRFLRHFGLKPLHITIEGDEVWG